MKIRPTDRSLARIVAGYKVSARFIVEAVLSGRVLLAQCTIALLWSGAVPAQSTSAVASLLEARRHQVVMQQWDLSCGAAALATILRFQHGDPVTEREIAIGMMSRDEYLANPNLINLREGFSLLDLKRFVDNRGYNGVGLGQLGINDLIDYAPIIVPISVHGYRHFVVFRGVLENRVLLADPAFGNRTMTISRFEESWLTMPELGRIGFYVERLDGLIPPNQLAPADDDFVTLR